MLVFNKEKLLDFFFLVKIHTQTQTQTQTHTYILTLAALLRVTLQFYAGGQKENGIYLK